MPVFAFLLPKPIKKTTRLFVVRRVDEPPLFLGAKSPALFGRFFRCHGGPRRGRVRAANGRALRVCPSAIRAPYLAGFPSALTLRALVPWVFHAVKGGLSATDETTPDDTSSLRQQSVKNARRGGLRRHQWQLGQSEFCSQTGGRNLATEKTAKHCKAVREEAWGARATGDGAADFHAIGRTRSNGHKGPRGRRCKAPTRVSVEKGAGRGRRQATGAAGPRPRLV